MPTDYLALTIQFFRAGRQWATRAELAQQLAVHERTVQRLIDRARAEGVPIDEGGRTGSLALEYRRRGSI